MTTSENPELLPFEHGIRELIKNYETRAAHAPEPKAQWADIAQDLKRLVDGTVHRRDVGKYRLCTVTAADGKVTNWQRELPDGEWRKVQTIPQP